MECVRFIEEKVGQSESAEFLRHLATCSGCQRDVEEMDDVRGLYKAASNERYAGGIPRLRRFGLGAWVSSAAAAAAMIAALVFLLLPPARNAEVAKADPAALFFRVHVEPWRADARFDHALDTCWGDLDRLERSR